MKNFILKAVNPNWDRKTYSNYGSFASKEAAQTEKSRLQGLGFVKVCIKKRSRIIAAQ